MYDSKSLLHYINKYLNPKRILINYKNSKPKRELRSMTCTIQKQERDEIPVHPNQRKPKLQDEMSCGSIKNVTVSKRILYVTCSFGSLEFSFNIIILLFPSGFPSHPGKKLYILFHVSYNLKSQESSIPGISDSIPRNINRKRNKL